MLRRFIALFAATLLGMMSGQVQASAAGTYWNPSQPGLGWAFEVQNDTVFALQYAYEGATVQPTFRSCIGTVTYQLLADGHVRENMAGDCYRTENFNQTVKTGPFTAVYEFGKISLNAAGFLQSNLVPFDFGFEPGIKTIDGIWLVSTLPLSGTGQSVTVVFSPTTGQTSTGIPTRSYWTSDGQIGLLAYFASTRQYVALSSLTVGQPANTLQMFTFPADPFAYGVLLGQATEDVLLGTGCQISTITNLCITPALDEIAKSLSNSPGETAVLRAYYPALTPPPASTAKALQQLPDPELYFDAAQRLLDDYRRRMVERVRSSALVDPGQ